MNLNKIYLTTPEGKIAIVKSKICAIVASEVKGANDTLVRTRVFVDADSEPFNVLEDFESVCDKI
jgi:hypothetical protein